MEGKLNESFHLLDNNSELFNDESLILLGDTFPLTDTLHNPNLSCSDNSPFILANYIIDPQEHNRVTWMWLMGR